MFIFLFDVVNKLKTQVINVLTVLLLFFDFFLELFDNCHQSLLPNEEIFIWIGILVGLQNPSLLLTEVDKVDRELLKFFFEFFHFVLEARNWLDLVDELHQSILLLALLTDAGKNTFAYVGDILRKLYISRIVRHCFVVLLFFHSKFGQVGVLECNLDLKSKDYNFYQKSCL